MKLRTRLFCLVLLSAIPNLALTDPPHGTTDRPFNSSKSLDQIDIAAYQTTLKVGEHVAFDAKGIRHVMIDEAKYVEAVVKDGKLLLRGRKAGKAAVRLIWMEDPDIELDHNQKHGMRVPRTVFFLTITPAEEKS